MRSREPGRVPPSGSAQRVVERGGGRPLGADVQRRMGAAFGMDLGAVRVHTDARADALNQALSAEASTVGHHIYFREGAYRPGTPRGTRLLAHELTHVAQQGGRSRARPTVGGTGTGAEHEAEAAADRVAAGGTVDAGAVTPVAGGVVQRRYLDAVPAQQGYRNWIKDTTAKKGLVTVGREKLEYVDGVLRNVLGPWGTTSFPATLPLLDAALHATKYDQPAAAKSSPTFVKRRVAVYRLRHEIHNILPPAPLDAPPPLPTAAAPPAMAPTAVAPTAVAPTAVPPAVVPPAPVPPPVVAPPVVAPPTAADALRTAAVTALERVGFVRSFLDGLPDTDLLLLHEADQALAAGDRPRAQRTFDQLNPPVGYAPGAVRPVVTGWADEEYESIAPNSDTPFLDFRRHKSDLMAAQRQLIAFHAPTIGGDYATLLSYKPYKANPLTQAEVDEGARYFTSTELRDWDTLVTTGIGGNVLLDDAVDEAPNIADASTAASVARGKNKPRKAELTREEITALRIYTADEYREMNAVFRDFRIDNPTANWAKYSAIAKLAISGLGKLPKARGRISYRGDNDVRFGGHAGLLRKGATFRLPNFYSTTTAPFAAFEGDLGYVFHNKRGGRLIDTFSAFQGEAEILIPPGTAFAVTAEFHRPPGGTWQSADGTSGLTGHVEDFAAVDPDRDSRVTYLEFDER